MHGTNTESVAPEFQSLVGQSGVHVRDPIEDVQAMLYTNRSVSPAPAGTGEFVYPVDSACEIAVSRLRTPFLIGIWVRDPNGNSIAEFEPNGSPVSLPRDDYLLEFTGMGMKMYARVETAVRIAPDDDAVDIDFGETVPVRIGARSNHAQPAQTLTTTSEPTDIMHAVSLLGNAMKTWSPERSWPSLRGHPPLLEMDDELEIPDGLTPPETGVRITVPPECEWIYPVVPLAYWLGATIEEGTPTLYVDGKSYPLGAEGPYRSQPDRQAFEKHVRDILQGTFLLDCAVRTEGFYDVELDVRHRLEDAEIPLDYEHLYDAPLDERVRTYLDLDRSIAELIDGVGRPGWRLTADVEAKTERATILPFLARDLAVVRCPVDDRITRDAGGVDHLDVFSRGGTPTVTGGGAITRTTSSSDSAGRSAGESQVIDLPPAKSASQAWVGDGFAVGAAKATTTSYLQRLEARVDGNSRISIDVVVNDDRMAEEADVSSIYGTRDYLQFDIDLHEGISTGELARVFEEETDFVHYIGHVDDDGFDCSDGYLDVAQLGTVKANTFVLNACSSYEQGQELVAKGAIGGVVTLEEVVSSMATEVGKTIARLLNHGFPLDSATNLVREVRLAGSHYAVVGDGNAAVAQSSSAIPYLTRVDLCDDDTFEVCIETFAGWNYHVGSMHRPYIDDCNCHYVIPGELDTWRVTHNELNAFLELHTHPVIAGRELFWSDEISASEIRNRLKTRS